MASVSPLSLSLPNLATVTKQQVFDYFENTWSITEALFSGLNDDAVFHCVPDSLRRPLIFYYGHVAVFYTNKLVRAGILKEEERIHPHFEELFAVGVDEMSWDHKNEEFEWPAVSEVREYRQKVYKLVKTLMAGFAFTLPITWDSVEWVFFMGMEHERIHIETSSVLFRQLETEKCHQPPASVWPAVAPTYGHPPANDFVDVEAGRITIGKPRDWPSYGWDNEYDQEDHEVPAFRAQKFKVTNAEFLDFVKAGGYQRRELWDEEGWGWNSFRQFKHPLFWVETSEGYKYRTVFTIIDMPWDWPVDVNYHEAKAYSRFKGPQYRLPTEHEHLRMRGQAPSSTMARENVIITDTMSPAEAVLAKYDIDADYMYSPTDKAPYNINLKYSSSTPVHMYSSSPAGFYDVFGNVWEWTETHNDGLKGFKVHPLYEDFSTPCFDARHNMIVGGSWISTGNEASIFARYAFRRHFFQHCGFRLVSTTAVASAAATSLNC